MFYWTKKMPFIQSAAFWYCTWCLSKGNNLIYTRTCLRLAFLDTTCILHYPISSKSCILNNSASISRFVLLQVETVHMWWPIETGNSLKNYVQKLLHPEDPLKMCMFLGFCLNFTLWRTLDIYPHLIPGWRMAWSERQQMPYILQSLFLLHVLPCSLWQPWSLWSLQV